MTMIIGIICNFLSYVIFHQQLKISFRKSSAPLKKSTLPFLLTSPLKSQKVQVPPFFYQHRKFFSPVPRSPRQL